MQKERCKEEELKRKIATDITSFNGDVGKVVGYITDNFLHFDIIEDLIQNSTSHLWLSMGLAEKMGKLTESGDY